MLGDVLLINDLHKEAARVIRATVLERKKKKKNGYRFIVGMAGESGSGKSELAHCLGMSFKEVAIPIKVIHTDNYYLTNPRERRKYRKEHGVSSIGLKEYDWVKLNKTMYDFKHKQESVLPCIDLISENVDKLIIDFKDIEVLIVEGLYATNAKGIDLKIFIDLTFHETKMSQLVRLKEAMDEERMQILEQEHKNVITLKSKSHLIVDKMYQVVKKKDYKESAYLPEQA